METTKISLVQQLKSDGVLKTKEIIAAFEAIDRKDFVLPEYAERAYVNAALPIDHNQTISQPYTVAFMLEKLEPQRGERILDVGSGSGWTTALLAYIVGSKGQVFGIERVPELVAFGKTNLAKYTFNNAEILQSRAQLGLPKGAPFDRILVSASTTEVPKELVAQLKIGGTMIIPIEYALCKVTRTSKNNIDMEKFEGFVFVPLVQKTSRAL